jgi:hypothetical protein
MFNPFVKAVLAMLAGVAGALGAGYDDSVLTTTEVVIAISAGFVGFTGVWAFTSAAAKAGIAAVVAGLATLGPSLADDKLSAQEVTTLAVIVLGALTAVYKIPNDEPAPTP